MDRKEWERRKLSSTENSTAELWRSNKEIVGWSSTGPHTKLFHEGNFVNSPTGLATTLNSFFINKVKGLRNSIPVVHDDPLAKLRESMNSRQCTFKMKQVTQEDVLKIINSLNNSSSTGVDFIDAPTLKLVKNEILPAMTKIINLSIEKSVFPAIYNHSQIIPLKKKTSLSDLECSSYRPVNLLPIPGKIVEKNNF